MPLRGSAFLAIWHDIEEHGELEYDDWHTREHMPERVGIPGFEAGRRWVDRQPRPPPVLHALRGRDARRARLGGLPRAARRPHALDAQGAADVHQLRARRLSRGRERGTGDRWSARDDSGRLRRPRPPGAVRARERGRSRRRRSPTTGSRASTSASRSRPSPGRRRPSRRSGELTGEEVFDAVVLVDGIGRAEVEARTPVDRGGVRAGPWPRPRRRPPSTTWRTRSRRRTSEPRRPAHRLDARPRDHRRPDRAGPLAGGVERALPAERRRRRLRPDAGSTRPGSARSSRARRRSATSSG